MRYSYEVPRQYCETHGLRFSEDMAAQADAVFAELDLTQAQVDRLVCHHAWVVNHLFNPRAYGWLGRLAIAARFLFGIGGR
ncbi:MAG: hypothetical protein ING29_13140 [Azospirillum sp.]|jgi:hypothetical protein|nr:hypothetical protein [Azospirillum sp.]